MGVDTGKLNGRGSLQESEHSETEGDVVYASQGGKIKKGGVGGDCCRDLEGKKGGQGKKRSAFRRSY